MKYVILRAAQREETIVTEVEFDLDGVKVRAAIPHFSPRTREEVYEGIRNRGLSEAVKLQAVATAATLIPQIEINKEVVV